MDERLRKLDREGYSYDWIMGHIRLGLLAALNKEELAELQLAVSLQQSYVWTSADEVFFSLFRDRLQDRVFQATRTRVSIKVRRRYPGMAGRADAELDGYNGLLGRNPRGKTTHWFERSSLRSDGEELRFLCRHRNGCAPPRDDVKFLLGESWPTCNACQRAGHREEGQLYYKVLQEGE